MKRFLILLAAAAAVMACSKAPAETSDEISLEDAVVYELNTRQATAEGTFAAAEELLPRLKELGVDIIWMMPIYEIGELERKGSLGSYYAIKDYCAPNPEFGTLEDFDSFLSTAHELGFKVIIDWVANHTSPDCAWVTEKPAEWYHRDENGKTIVEYDWTDIAKLNYDCPDVREAMKDCMRFWFDRGIDGLRCDVAYQVPQDFWQDAISAIRSEYSGKDLFFLAEGEETWLHEVGFDATYAWKEHHLMNDLAQGKVAVDSLVRYINWNDETYPENSYRLSFTSNHDENSWNGTEFERMGEAWKAMSVLAWTLPNTMPLIYTGQEMGYDHRFAFFDKDPMPEWSWNSYTDFYKYLTGLKKAHPALNSTEGEFSLISTDNNTIVFERSNDWDKVRVSVQLEAPWEWSVTSASDRVSRIEPPSWWTGMKTDLRLMIHGDAISEWTVSVEGEGVSVAKAEKAESPNYLFVDVNIAPTAEQGTYWLVFTKGEESFKIPYEIAARKEGSAERESFGTADAIYLLMPDRFVNGDPANDSTCDTEEKVNTDPNEYFGRYGGDIQGIEDKLDYIAGLGFTAVWATPLLEDNEPEASYHGYACTDYYNIDSRFGSNYKYREMVEMAAERGIKVIMDMVPNHCGDKHWWMEDLPYEDWIHQWPEYTHSNCAFSAQNDPYCSQLDRENMIGGWFDKSMVDMNLDNPQLLKYFQQWAIWWTEWAGLGGFRVDTYPYNEKVPMSEWNMAILNEYPNLNIVGEVWSNNVPQVAYWQADNPNKDGFNSHLPSIMDFCLQSAWFSLNTDVENWDSGITKIYDVVANNLYYHDVDNKMIFSANHDQDRLADCLGEDPRKVKMVMAMLATLPGYPQIFAGDEIMAVSSNRSQGHGGLRVPFNEAWESDATSKDVHDYTAKVFNWRKTSAAVQEGSMTHFLTRENTYAYFRQGTGETVFVYLNNNAEPHEIPWADYAEITSSLSAEGVDIVTGEAFKPENCVVPAKSALIVEFK